MRHSRVPHALWQVVKGVAVGAWSGLALFHVWLFWGQWHDGRLADPVIAAKWIGSALLLGALAMLHRSGRALVFGRQGIALWTLAAVLHVGAGQPAAVVEPAASHGVLFVVPAVIGAALVSGALVAAARRARRSRLTHGPVSPRAAVTHPLVDRLPFLTPCALRAPPCPIG